MSKKLLSGVSIIYLIAVITVGIFFIVKTVSEHNDILTAVPLYLRVLYVVALMGVSILLGALAYLLASKYVK